MSGEHLRPASCRPVCTAQRRRHARPPGCHGDRGVLVNDRVHVEEHRPAMSLSLRRLLLFVLLSPGFPPRHVLTDTQIPVVRDSGEGLYKRRKWPQSVGKAFLIVAVSLATTGTSVPGRLLAVDLHYGNMQNPQCCLSFFLLSICPLCIRSDIYERIEYASDNQDWSFSLNRHKGVNHCHIVYGFYLLILLYTSQN